MKQIKWMKNYISADTNGDSGSCPFCGSTDTDYVIVQDPSFIEVWCNTCFSMDNMCYRGTPKFGRKIMTGDEYANWKRKLAEDCELGRIVNYPSCVDSELV